MNLTTKRRPLVPFCTQHSAAVAPVPQTVPTQGEWAAYSSEIERLYVRERRKLRYIMQYMAREHGFKATEQMYKKRFSKWGFQKNSRRSAAPVLDSKTQHVCGKVVKKELVQRRKPTSGPRSLDVHQHDNLMLMLLTSVRRWNLEFFGSVQSNTQFPVSAQERASSDQSQLAKIRETSFTVKLLTDLLDRGHGELAGRTARKAFLLVEDMLTLEGPVLVWNLLDMMHHMLKLGHVRLFQLLLAHIIALVDDQFPEEHPLATMLRALRGLVTSLTNAGRVPTNSIRKGFYFDTSRSRERGPEVAATNTWPASEALSYLLERAWNLNAEIVFANFDARLFHLYARIHWESCSVNPPPSIFGAKDDWFAHIGMLRSTNALSEVAFCFENLPPATAAEEKKLLLRLLAPRRDASPPLEYDMLRASSIVALQDRGSSVFQEGLGPTADTNTLLRILAGLVKIDLFDKIPILSEHYESNSFATDTVPRVDAENLACMIKTLFDLESHQRGKGILASQFAVDRIRAIVALREYARGESDPQLMRDMWLLSDALVAAGELGEAQEVACDALRRMRKYIRDIPVDSV